MLVVDECLDHRVAHDQVLGRQESIIVLVKLETCMIVRGFIPSGGRNDDQGLDEAHLEGNQ
jgi:hypothetical protein